MSDNRLPEVQAIYNALSYLTANDQDFVAEQNGAGYNARDRAFGHSLSDQIEAGRNLSPKQLIAAHKMLFTYRTQLKQAGIILPEKMPQAVFDALPKATNGGDISVRLVSDRLCVKSPYNVDRIAKFKEAKGKWDSAMKEWTFEVTALPKLIEMGIPVHPSIVERYKQLEGDGKLPTITAPSGKPAAPHKSVVDFTKPPKVDHKYEPAMIDAALGLYKQVVADSGFVPLKHQSDYIKWCVKNGGRVICALDVGLGKTLSNLIPAAIYATQYNAKVIVIAPISLHENWRREAAKVGLEVQMVSWAKIPPAPKRNFVLICDEVHYCQHYKIKWLKDEDGKPLLDQNGRQMKQISPKRTASMLELAESPNCVAWFGLTGTPVPNGRPAGLYPLLKASRHWLALDKRAYEVTFCDAKKTRWSAWDISGVANEKTLRSLYELSNDVVFRRKKNECADLPILSRNMRPVTLSASATKTYEETVDRLRSEWMAKVNAGEISSKNEALVSLGHLLHAVSVAKVETTAELVKELTDNGNQVIVSFQYKESIEMVARMIEVPYGIITGDTPTKDRQTLVDSFQRGEIKAVLCTYGAGGVGLNMQKGDYVILHDRPWRPGDVEQIEGRAWRMGRKMPVISVWPQANTTDLAVDQVLEAKQRNIDMIVDGKAGAGFAIDLVIDGEHTILPDFKESIGEIAHDLLNAIFKTRHRIASDVDTDEDTGDDEETEAQAELPIEDNPINLDEELPF